MNEAGGGDPQTRELFSDVEMEVSQCEHTRLLVLVPSCLTCGLG